MNGLLFVDKPKGMTSQGVCNKIKRIFNTSKVGHNGTLDPNTTGLMMIAINDATKMMRFISEHDKEYIAKVAFGFDSDTLDFDGNITNEITMNITKEEVIDALNKELERTLQIPPLTSAIHVDGRRLYEWQRDNIEVEVKPREVKLLDYDLIDFYLEDNHYYADIRVHVSKGYYVRSLARDLGISLNGCAILKELRRTKMDTYNVSNAKRLEDITPNDLISIEDFFKFPSIYVNDYLAKLVRNGAVLDSRQTTLHEPFYVRNKNDIIAIYEEVSDLRYKPVLILKKK